MLSAEPDTILAGRGMAGQCRSCERPMPTRRRRASKNVESPCLAATSLIAKTSGNAIKLTKISCDIAATPVAEPLDATAPGGLSSIAPSGQLTRPSTAGCLTAQRSTSPRLHHRLQPDRCRPWQELLAGPLMLSVIFSCARRVGTFSPPDLPPRGRASSPLSLLEHITIWADLSVRFAAPQKPSPLSCQALGSAKADQPLW